MYVYVGQAEPPKDNPIYSHYSLFNTTILPSPGLWPYRSYSILSLLPVNLGCYNKDWYMDCTTTTQREQHSDCAVRPIHGFTSFNFPVLLAICGLGRCAISRRAINITH